MHRRSAYHTKLHLAADAHGLPVRAFVAQDATADCARAIALIDGFAAERLLVDKGCDTDEILARAEKQGMETIIPPKKSRRERRDCDKESCRARRVFPAVTAHPFSGGSQDAPPFAGPFPPGLRPSAGLLVAVHLLPRSGRCCLATPTPPI
ncbi:transposase [uncultured Desulfovibrio sp.]|uniref:transposase n=1 Tax=uncultured Desulfovibrio sp. TaxID=167968 RepID=UPI00345B731F